MIDTNSSCSETKYNSCHSLMASTINPSFISSTPTFWSASQLLAGHEHRTGVTGHDHDGHALSTILEEGLDILDTSDGVTNLGYRSHPVTPDNDRLSDSSGDSSVVTECSGVAREGSMAAHMQGYLAVKEMGSRRSVSLV